MSGARKHAAQSDGIGWMIATYALAAYLIFLGTIALIMAFLLGVGPVVIDAGPAGSATASAAIDLGLIALFGLQHGIMARRRFKEWLTRAIPAAAERSTFVLAASLLLLLLAIAWHPLPQPIWTVQAPWPRGLLTGIALAGWLLLFAATFAIDHFEQFGLRSTVLSPRPRGDDFRTPFMYRYVRHPQQLGLIVLFWATPSMTAGRLLLAAGMTTYILIGLRYEERDLIVRFGDAYRDYRQRVPMLFPLP